MFYMDINYRFELGKELTDYHVHIGQFNEVYYDALELFELIKIIFRGKNGIYYINYFYIGICCGCSSGVQEF